MSATAAARLAGCLSGSGGSGGGFRGFLAFRLKGLALHFAHFLFEGALEIGGCLAEFGHEFAETAGELRQLLWPENDQDHDKRPQSCEECSTLRLGPKRPTSKQRPMGIIERASAGVKPEYAFDSVCYNFSLRCHREVRMKSERRGLVVVVAVLLVSAVLGGIYGPNVRATTASADDYQTAVRDFTRVLDVVQNNYADPVDADKAVYQGAIPGMLRMLDPHSNFFDAKQFALLREDQRGKYYGVGMVVAPRENHTVVMAPYVGAPAYNAGIRPGDVITKVDDKSTDGLTTSEVADMLKGPKGTVVKIRYRAKAMRSS